jgi:preprotein translocase subunit YajC
MAAPDVPGGGFSLLLFQILAIGLVFYFLILRPQSQARKKHEALLKNVKKGDEITTAGGIIGKVKDVKEDRVTIESGGSTLVVERARIIRVGDSAPAPGAAG